MRRCPCAHSRPAGGCRRHSGEPEPTPLRNWRCQVRRPATCRRGPSLNPLLQQDHQKFEWWAALRVFPLRLQTEYNAPSAGTKPMQHSCVRCTGITRCAFSSSLPGRSRTRLTQARWGAFFATAAPAAPAVRRRQATMRIHPALLVTDRFPPPH